MNLIMMEMVGFYNIESTFSDVLLIFYVVYMKIDHEEEEYGKICKDPIFFMQE